MRPAALILASLLLLPAILPADEKKAERSARDVLLGTFEPLDYIFVRSTRMLELERDQDITFSAHLMEGVQYLGIAASDDMATEFIFQLYQQEERLAVPLRVGAYKEIGKGQQAILFVPEKSGKYLFYVKNKTYRGNIQFMLVTKK